MKEIKYFFFHLFFLNLKLKWLKEIKHNII